LGPFSGRSGAWKEIAFGPDLFQRVFDYSAAAQNFRHAINPVRCGKSDNLSYKSRAAILAAAAQLSIRDNAEFII
jgi:hypothetical protein